MAVSRRLHIPILLLLIALISINQATAQKKQHYSVIDTITMNNMDKKKFDIEEFEKNKIRNDWEYKKDDGTYIWVHKSGNEDYVEIETPPPPKLYQIYRIFHLNGNIKMVGIELRRINVGVWKEYDEEGNLIKETNWDEKYGKFDYNKVVLFLAEKGHIDLKTGRGREDLALTYNEEKKLWDATIWPSANNDRLGYYYFIDGNSGKVKKSGRVQPGG